MARATHFRAVVTVIGPRAIWPPLANWPPRGRTAKPVQQHGLPCVMATWPPVQCGRPCDMAACDRHPRPRRWCAQHAPGVALHSSVEEMAEKGGGGAAGASARRRRLALVASRTADMPALFAQVLAADCSHVYGPISVLHRHRRRYVHCAGMVVPALEMTAVGDAEIEPI